VVVAVPPEGPNRQPFPAVRPFKEEEEKRPGDEYVARLEMLQAIEEWAFPASLRRLLGRKGGALAAASRCASSMLLC
jgi:hypothetical protein